MTADGFHPLELRSHRVDPITVALVNNTGDRALAGTEVQFLKLLRSAATGLPLRVKFFTCPEIPRETLPRAQTGEAYGSVSALLNTHVDALIVTGMEPTSTNLRDEPAWTSLAALINWAYDNEIPAIWSCLAAHAAVLHLDGIGRARQPVKLSDIFDCERVSSDSALTWGTPPQWSMPHSRYYGLPETALLASGYHVLSRSPAAGVDIFMKSDGVPFLFFQGHPEYDPNTLLGEYRRDLRRYFAGTRDEYPIAPTSYFDPETALFLAQCRDQVLETGRDPKLLARILDIARRGSSPISWFPLATNIYANWLCAFVLGARRSQEFVPTAPGAGLRPQSKHSLAAASVVVGR
jgi:homoserine O-succinyltransferase